MTEDERVLTEYILDPDKGGMTQEDFDAALADGATIAQIYGACAAKEFFPTPQAAPASDWPPLIPFDEVELPPFPADVLPWPLDALTEALSECFQVAPAMPGVLALGVLAGLFQGKYKLNVKPGFTSELSLYTCAVAAPGERKTPVFKYLTAPINHYERQRQEQEAPEIQRNQQQKKLLMGQQRELEGKLIKGGKGVDRDKVKVELEAVNQELDAFVDEYGFRILADDTTNERLIDLLDKHGAILVASDEPGLFTSLKGRYDHNSSIDVFLKGIDGSYIRVDRIGRPSNSVPDPHLSLALGAQPAAIRDFVNNPVFAGRGLVQRFLYASCAGAAGGRRWDVEQVPTAVSMGYERLVQEALSLEVAEPVVLHFTEEAQQEARRFGNEAEAALQEGGALDFDKGWGNKFPGYVFRMAALFQLVEAVMNGLDPSAPIDKDWLVSAEKIGWCLAEHTKSIFTEAGADPDTEDAKYILRRVVAIGKPKVSKRDLIRKCQSNRFKSAEDMNPGLRQLEERGYIRTWVEQTGRPGKPPEWILLNPITLNA